MFGTRVRYPFSGQYDIMSTKEKQATPKAAFVFLVPLANEQPAKQAGKRGLESGREHERKTSDTERNLIRQIGFINEQRRSF